MATAITPQTMGSTLSSVASIWEGRAERRSRGFPADSVGWGCEWLASANGGKDADPVAVGQDVVKTPGYAVDENDFNLLRRDP